MVLGKSSTTSLSEGISHSIGVTTFVPYTSWKGLNLVTVLEEVRYAQSAENNAKF